MSRFATHTLDKAPEGARDLPEQAVDNYGFLPNLMATMPELVKAYAAVGDLFTQTGFTPIEQQVVLLTISGRNGCDYCMAACSGLRRTPRFLRDSRRRYENRVEFHRSGGRHAAGSGIFRSALDCPGLERSLIAASGPAPAPKGPAKLLINRI